MCWNFKDNLISYITFIWKSFINIWDGSCPALFQLTWNDPYYTNEIFFNLLLLFTFFWQILLRLCLTVSSMILPTYRKKWHWFYFLYWPSPALWNSSKTCSVHKTKHWDCLESILYRANIKLGKSLPACNLLVNSIEFSHIFFKKSISLTNSK